MKPGDVNLQQLTKTNDDLSTLQKAQDVVVKDTIPQPQEEIQKPTQQNQRSLVIQIPHSPNKPFSKVDVNPCDSTNCYASKVAPILKKFIDGRLDETELVEQIMEKTKTNNDEAFKQKVLDSIKLAKEYIKLKREIEETTKQIDKIQKTNSILGDELSLEKVKKIAKIEKITQRTAEVNAIKLPKTSFTDVVDIRITAVANYETLLQTALATEIGRLETKKSQRGYVLTWQETKDLRSFKHHRLVLWRKARGNAEIQNMKNDLIGIKKTITAKSNMIYANEVKVKSNEDGKTLALIKQEQIKIELQLN